MPGDPAGERLAAKRHVTVILRLVLEPDGTLVHGEVADVESRPRARFVAWHELARAVQSSVEP